MAQIIRTVCPHDCPDMCSMLVHVEDGRVVRVEGDPDHPFTRGFLCGKVNLYHERVHSDQRVLYPMRRTGAKGEGAFVRISWDEALDEIVSRWQQIIDQYGSEALLALTYSGHMGLINRQLFLALFHRLGASRLLRGAVCDSACEAGWRYSVGPAAGTDPERVVDSDLIIAWGANIVTTNVHMVPLVDEARRRGAQFIVIDPYRNRSARRADWYIPIKIGTDTALALGLMHVLVRDNLIDRDYIDQYTVGFEALRDQVLPQYTPERVAEITGVPAADVERLAHLYGRARAPFIRLGMGMSRNTHGGMAVRTVACLPGLVGAWRRPGGGALLDTAAAFNLNYNALRRPDLLPRPVREINQAQLGRALTELDDPPVKALFVAAYNPATTCPDNNRVREGLAREDLFTVVHESFMSDTALYADILLPASTSFESEDVYRSYGQYYIQFGPQLIPPQGESWPNRRLVQELAARFGFDDPVFYRDTAGHMTALLDVADGPCAGLDPAALVAEQRPFKLPVPPIGHLLADGFPTPSGKLEFYSEAMAADGLPPLPEWRPDPVELVEGLRFPLRLLTAPGHFQHHSAFAGVERLQLREGAPSCLLNPADAAARGISDGDKVELYNDRGYVGMYARVTEETMPGVVVVEAQRARHRYLSGGPLNCLTSDRLTDMGAGATYQSTWLDVRLLL